MLNKKRLGSLLRSWLPFLMGVLLLSFFGFSQANAQVTWKTGDTTYIPLEHSMTSYGDSMKYKLGSITLVEGTAGNLLATAGDSIQIKAPSGFRLVKDSVITIAASSVGGLKFDTTGFFTTFGITQTSVSTIKLKATNLDASGPYISLMVKTISSGTVDTLSISGLYAQSTTSAASYDSTTVANIAFSQLTVAANSVNLSRLVAVTGNASKIVFSQYPNASQKAGYYISTAAGGSQTIVALAGIQMIFQDKANNITARGISNPSVAALIHNSSSAGNGTLASNKINKITAGANADQIGVSFDGLTYTKAETIDLQFTFGSSIINTVTAGGITGGIGFGPGDPAHLAVSKPSSEAFTVGGSALGNWIATVTDAFSNPVNVGGNTYVHVNETPAHGGVISGAASGGATFTGDSTGITVSGGLTGKIIYTPSNYYTGNDTLTFTLSYIDGSSAYHAVATFVDPSIVVSAGPAAGLYVDYSATASGAATTEQIAAGNQVYARGFLHDTYGNPVNAVATTDVTFKITSVLGKNNALGTAALTSAISEAQYPNANKTSVGVTVPYTVSTNVTGNADSILATAGSYSSTLTIQNRSNVPTTLKMVQSTGTDSSLVVSNYTLSIAFRDTLWDQYKNLVIAPDKSYKIAPTLSSYAVYFTTNGHTKFIGTANSSDTTTADTLYPANGTVTRTLASYKVSGMDTVRTWSSASASVKGSTPVWVTPAAFAKLVVTPKVDSLLVAGKTTTLTAEKEDTYGNHIDFGLSGGELRGNAPATTKPVAGTVHADSALFVADTITTGKNRGGVVTQKWTLSGTPGVASVGGTYNITFPFTAYTAGADTQKVFASFGGKNDTAIVYSIATGGLRSFLVKIDNSGSHFVGDSVSVTVTAQDSNSNRIYTYYQKNQTLALDHSDVMPVSTKDTTYYFSFSTPGGKYVKTQGNHPITDTLFKQGMAKVTLWKFHVDSTNTVTINGGGFTATSGQSVTYKPLIADTAYNKWTVTLAKDTLIANSPFDFTVTPRDYYYNVAAPKNIIVNIASNQTSGFNVGSNPKVVNGTTSFTGSLSGATDNLLIYVFNSDNSQIYGVSTPATILTGVDQVPSVPKVYSLAQNFPNPFNPSTTIRYELPKAGLVTLKVYDILGREVASLVNEKQAAGKYSVDFNANKLASGVYIYRIQSGDFTSVKKLMLLK